MYVITTASWAWNSKFGSSSSCLATRIASGTWLYRWRLHFAQMIKKQNLMCVKKINCCTPQLIGKMHKTILQQRILWYGHHISSHNPIICLYNISEKCKRIPYPLDWGLLLRCHQSTLSNMKKGQRRGCRRRTVICQRTKHADGF